MADELTIEPTELNKPYWDSLERGTLSFQKCSECGHGRLPAREECPKCLSPKCEWVPSTGNGKVFSWVVYHTSMDPSTKDRVPYNVAIVELEEGPRIITNLLTPNDQIKIGMPVRLSPEKKCNVNLPYFVPA